MIDKYDIINTDDWDDYDDDDDEYWSHEHSQSIDKYKEDWDYDEYCGCPQCCNVRGKRNVLILMI
jgi:hypothetical protein